MTTVAINASIALGPMPKLYACRNTSLRFAPPPEVLARSTGDFGRAQILRTFLTLDELWDYRDDSFHFDFLIGHDRYQDDVRMHRYDKGRTTPSGVSYYRYIDACAAHADELLLCFRRYEHEVVNGVIGMGQYQRILDVGLRHYLDRCHNLRWIEVTNESECDHFGGLDDDAYYRFFSAAGEVVARINDQLPMSRRLRIGGPAASSPRFDRVRAFLKRFAEDPAPGKRLDFVSYHDYHSGDRPARVAERRAELDGWLSENGLPGSLPAFVTETGTHEGRNEGGNLGQAAGLSLLLDVFRRQHDTRVFPWCLYHDPQVQQWSTQLLKRDDGSIHLTPGGCAMKMLGMHRSQEVSAEQDGLDADGRGVLALASRDHQGLVVQVVNYAKRSDLVRLRIEHPPAGLMRQFRVNSSFSNCLADPRRNGDLEEVANQPIAAGEPVTLQLELEPYDVWMASIEARG